MSEVLTALAVLLFLVHASVVTRRQGLFTAESLFAVAQMVVLLGTWIQYEPDLDAYVSMCAASASIFLGVALVAALVHPPRGREPIALLDRDLPPRSSTWLLLGVSGLVVAAYLGTMGESAFLVGLGGLLTGDTSSDIAGVRLSAYAGDEYRAPGFANLFKNTIFPATVMAVTPFLYRRGGLPGRAMAALLFVAAAAGLLATGQRSAFVYFLLTVVGYFALLRGRAITRASLLWLGMGVVIFGLVSAALRRTAETRSFGLSAIVEVWERVVLEAPGSGIVAYRLARDANLPLMLDWSNSLAGLLPGRQSGVTLAGLAAESLGWRGTVPPTLAGSAWANLTALGAVLFFMILGAALPMLSRAGTARPGRTRLELLGISGTFVAWGTWVAGGPETPLLFGGIASGFLWVFGGIQRRRLSSGSSLLPPVDNGPRFGRDGHSAGPSDDGDRSAPVPSLIANAAVGLAPPNPRRHPARPRDPWSR